MGRYKRRKHVLDESDAGLQGHIKALGLESASDYRDWCAEHGFSRRLNKTANERCRERYVLSSAIAKSCLGRRRAETRKPHEVCAAICEGSLGRNDVVQPSLRLLATTIQATIQRDQPARRALARLIECCHQQKLRLLHEGLAVAYLGRRAGNTYIEALVAMASNHRHWLNDPASFRIRSHNVRRQFRALVRHLFCRYELPGFFDAVWFGGDAEGARRMQRWYIAVGEGASIRTCRLPIPYTKRMGHHFMHAPNSLTVEQAIRWGQVRALGMDERRSQALVQTRLGESFEQAEFWTTAVRFFIANPQVDAVQYGPLIDYLHHQRFVDQDVAFGGGENRAQGPLQPNLCLKGRRAETLIEQMQAWHRQLARDNTQFGARWRPSGIEPLNYVEGSKQSARRWTIRELLSKEALVVEGRRLQHCVARYAHGCRRGSTSIWTLECEDQERHRKLVTIEVRNDGRVIVQARGKANRLPTEQELRVIRRWVAQEELYSRIG